MHPMAVIELLWRSCCTADAEEQGSGLGTRLKVRQWTQLLVDQSLLLGSSSEGIHLHDIVLQYLRKGLSVQELRGKHHEAVDGMVAASIERVKRTGRGKSVMLILFSAVSDRVSAQGSLTQARRRRRLTARRWTGE